MSVLVQKFSKPKRPLAGSIALALALSLANLPILSAEAAEVTATGCPAVDVGSSSNITYARTGDFCILEFTGGTNSFVPPSGVTTISLIVVAGGGGGGVGWGGGGGAGGVLSSLSYAVSAGSTYNLTVGSGGSGGGSGQPGTDGGNSSFSGLIATGGGGGAGYGWRVDNYLADGRPGGSGGGAAEENAQIALGGSSTQQSYTNITSYGNRGGNQGNNTGSQAGSGGGGAGGAGGDVPSNSNSSNRQPGAGGAGISITVGKTFNLAGGGGGASRGIAGAGGSAGGVVIGGRGTLQNASTLVDDNTGINAVANTGSGGGGGMDGPGGNGSAGIVVIAFQTGGTPAYPGLTGPSSGLSGAIGAATSIGNSYSIVDSTSVGWSSVIARLSATQATLSATAAGSAVVSGAGTANLTITGSITDVQTTINSATFTKTNSTSGTLTLTVEPNSKFTSGGTTYYFWKGNGHYYRYLSTAAANNPSNQAGFLNYAMSTRFAGAGGYLLTVTGDSSTLSVEEERQEHDFIISTDILSLNKASQTYGPRAYTAGIRCDEAPATSATSCSGAVSSTFYWLPGPNAPLHERAKAIQNTTAGSYPWHSGGEPNQSARALAFSGWQTTADTFTRANTYTGTTETYTRAFMWDDFPHDSQFDGAVVEYGSNTSFAFTSHNQIQRELVASYTVTFNGNNNTSGSVPTNQTKTHNVDLTVPDNTGTLARNGYTFIGWNTAADGSGSSYAAGDSYSSNSSATLYARWLPISPPTEVEATPGYQSVTVGWTAPESAASVTPTSYIVQYSTTGTGTWTTASSNIDSSARSYQITGLTIGTQYYVRVAAVYSGVVGAYGYPWTLIFESTTASRQANVIAYTSTNGLSDNDIDLSRTDFTRVRYYIGAKYASSDATRLYVDANFDKAITNGATGAETYSSLIRLQVPIVEGGNQSQFEIQGNVSDVTVESNVATVTQGTNLSARLEIWPWNYATSASAGLSGGSRSATLYDDGDSWAIPGTYGSFQLHNIGSSPHTIFAWNRHYDSSPEIGFGNNTLYRSSANDLHPDWTFVRQSGSYTQRTDFLFQSYANLSVTPLGTYTITFDGNGNTGGAVPSNQTKTHAVDLTVATNSGLLVKSGYVFSGWNTSANGTGTTYAAGSTYSANTATTLYAQWSTNSLTITYNANGGSTPSGGSTTTLTGGTIASLPTTSYDGHSFVGWFTAVSGGLQVTTTSPHGQTENFTLFARWSADTYTITFDGNGNTGGSAPANQTKTHAVDLTVAGNSGSLVKSGYTFAGWNTSANGTGTSYAAESTYSANAATTLYAQWSTNSFTVTYDTQGGSSVTGVTTLTGGSLANPGTPTRAGYTFAGWFIGSSGGAALTFPYVHNQTSNFTLFAQWTANTYTVLYEYNGATANSSSASANYLTGGAGINLPNPTKTGYGFAGWFESSTLSGTAVSSPYTTTQNRTLYAKWTANNYSVSYSISVIENGETVTATSGTAPVDNSNYNIGQNLVVSANTGQLSRTGYVFAGWVTNSDGSGVAYSASQTITFGAANITLYPKWLPGTYTITYNKNGADGSLAKSTDTYTTQGDALTLPGAGTMSKAGYTFAGWSYTANGTAISNTSFTTSQNRTLYAVWTLANYTATYDLNGGSGGVTPSNQTANFETNITIASIGAATKDGHWFAGWNTAANRSGNSYGEGQVLKMPIGGLTLYAVWVPNTYRISYNSNGGAGGPDLSVTDGFDTATFGESYNIRAKNNISRTGYTFTHWSTNVDGSGVKYESNGDNLTVFTSFSPLANTVFYAQWTANEYTFTFNPAGGNNSPVDQSKTFGQTITLPSAGTRTGYTLSGWSDGTLIYPASGTYLVGAASVNFEAIWTPNVYSVLFDWQGGVGNGTASASYTVGTGNLSLPTVGDVTKDGFTFAGWSTTEGGATSSAIQPASNTVLYAVWNSGNYTLNYEVEGGALVNVAATVARGGEANLPSPTRDGFVLEGWYTSANGGERVGGAGDTYTPARSRSLYARWVQRSLAGVDLATLDSASEFNASSTTGTDTTITHIPSSTSARVLIPAGALPNGTKVNVQYFKDTDRQSTLIPGDNSYFFAVLVSWLYGSGSSATVPNTAAGKPILVTLRNDSIKAGAMVYMVIGTEVTEMGRATIDGEVTVELTQDPELVVAATAPSAPTSVVVASGDQSATISWSIPSTNGGSEIISYTVTASSGGGSCTTTSTSCSITGLTNGQDYSFTVIATNSVGNSVVALSASVSPTVASYTVTFNSNGGSSVTSGSFTSGGSVAEPSAPSRSGYTFNGWSTLLNNASSKVTFPYSPGTNANITLFALWTQIVSGSDSGSSSGSGGSGSGSSSGSSGGTSTSTGGSSGSGGSQTTSPGTGAGTGTGTGAGGSTGSSDPKPGSSSSSQIGFIPKEPEEPVHESGPVGSVEGTKEQAVFVRDSAGKQLSAEIGEVKLVIESGFSGGSGGLVTQKLELSLNVGESAALSGNGLLPNTFIEIWVFSDPIYLGSIAVDADGEFASTLALPNSLLPGLHTMQIGTLNAEGKLVKLSIPLIVRGSVSVGTFKGFVAIYTKDLIGQNLSARVAGRWIRQTAIQNFKNFNYSRLVRLTGAGYSIIIDVYINQKFYKRFTTRTR